MISFSNRAERALLIGCHGGVARAALSLLKNTTAGRLLFQRLEELVLVDQASGNFAPPPVPATVLPPQAIRSREDLARLVREHRITQVIDLSSIDTIDCVNVCDELGADFLCTSVEEWPGRASIPTDEAIRRFLHPEKPHPSRRSHLIGSGANPGLVNALVFAAMDSFASRVGVAATAEDLDLHSVLITEEDTTRDRLAESNGSMQDVFSMTWSPSHCLEELFEPRAFSARNGRAHGLGHRPTERRYRARCGDRLIEGMAVPHEETKTLARLLPQVEIAFIYRIPEAARRALAWHSQHGRVLSMPTRRLFPPDGMELVGEDRVGVLLCSRRYGEFWMGFKTDVSKGLPLGTNATQLQVAAGVLSGWSQLGERKGVHFVEDLDWRPFLRVASGVLGPAVEVYDPRAPVVSLADRVVRPTAPSFRISPAPVAEERKIS